MLVNFYFIFDQQVLYGPSLKCRDSNFTQYTPNSFNTEFWQTFKFSKIELENAEIENKYINTCLLIHSIYIEPYTYRQELITEHIKKKQANGEWDPSKKYYWKSRRKGDYYLPSEIDQEIEFKEIFDIFNNMIIDNSYLINMLKRKLRRFSPTDKARIVYEAMLKRMQINKERKTNRMKFSKMFFHLCQLEAIMFLNHYSPKYRIKGLYYSDTEKMIEKINNIIGGHLIKDINIEEILATYSKETSLEEKFLGEFIISPEDILNACYKAIEKDDYYYLVIPINSQNEYSLNKDLKNQKIFINNNDILIGEDKNNIYTLFDPLHDFSNVFYNRRIKGTIIDYRQSVGNSILLWIKVKKFSKGYVDRVLGW